MRQFFAIFINSNSKVMTKIINSTFLPNMYVLIPLLKEFCLDCAMNVPTPKFVMETEDIGRRRSEVSMHNSNTLYCQRYSLSHANH